LGTCDSIEEILIGEDKVIKFSGCKRNEACTIVLRGSSQHILEEAERSLHDALCVLVQTVKNKQVIYGGGNAEIQMAIECEKLAKISKGKEGIAIEAYGRALRALPMIIAENAGFDANELIHDLEIELQTRPDAGINIDTGLIDSMEKLAITVRIRLIKGMFKIKGAGADICERGSRNDNESGRHNYMRSKTERSPQTALIKCICMMVLEC
jgi:T-complex protein 1 subunit beta